MRKLILIFVVACAQMWAAGLPGKIVFKSAALGKLAAFDPQTRAVTAVEAGSHATLSPDGRTLAYFDIRDHLHIRKLDSGADTVLASAGDPHSASFVGNDAIAYIREGRRTTEICISPLAGGSERVWAGKTPGDLLSFMQIEWIPGTDLQRPSFILTMRSALYLISPSGARELVRGDSGVTCRYPAVSPDGRRVAYVMDDGRSDIYTLDLAGGSPRRLTNNGSSWPVWSPDGSYLAFMTTAAVTRGLDVRDAIGGESLRRTGGGSINKIAIMTPDGVVVAVLADSTGKVLHSSGDRAAWR